MRRSSRAGRIAAALATPVLLASVLAGAGLGSAQAATAGCASKAVKPFNPGKTRSLDSTAVLSPCNVWAVGSSRTSNNGGKTLIEHWDGSKWKVIPSPNPVGAKEAGLDSISAASPTSIWAAGAYDTGDATQSKTLILHWDGHNWTQQNTPSSGLFDSLNEVRAVSGGEAWAVGNSEQNKDEAPLVLHFVHSTWSESALPNLGLVHLRALTSTSSKDVWMVGGVDKLFGVVQTLILHWNGRSWTRTPSPSPGFEPELHSVAASSPTNALAVGFVQPENGPAPIKTLALHWNGKVWTRVPSVSPANADDEANFNGVAFTSKNTARAVGDFIGAFGDRSLIEQWNGKRFTLIKSPNPGPDPANYLFTIAATSTGDQWVTGINGLKTFVVHFTK